MAFCALHSPGAEHAESNRRLRKVCSAQSLCSRLLCGVIDTSTVYEQGAVRCTEPRNDISFSLRRQCRLTSAMCVQALFTTFQFQFPLVVGLAQMMTMVPVCYIVARPKIDWATAKAVFPLALVNTLNVVFGLVGKSGNHMASHLL